MYGYSLLLRRTLRKRALRKRTLRKQTKLFTEKSIHSKYLFYKSCLVSLRWQIIQKVLIRRN